MSKIVFSEEQSAIIQSTKDDECNIVVDAVAGSGKTTCICGICQHNAQRNVLILTYNRHLCAETQARFAKFNITNADIYTMHGFVFNFYDSSDYTDKIIRSTSGADKPIKSSKKNLLYDIIILDEFQDFNIHMIEILIKYIRDVKLMNETYTPKLVFLGDKYQCVYADLHGSDNRFLIHAPTLFTLFGQWKRMTLQTTYRLTHHMVNYMNQTMLKSNFFVPFKKGKRKPTYLITDVWSDGFHNFIIDYIKENGFKPDEIFILAPSVKSSRSPIYRLTNELSNFGYPIYYSGQFEDESGVAETQHKVTVNTYHVCKGRERKLSIVMSYDASYFNWFAKEQPEHLCTNQQYVASTRASEDIIFVRSHKEANLEFLDMPSLYETCNVVVLNSPSIEDERKKKGFKVDLAVTSLLEYLTYDVIHYATCFYKSKSETTNINVVLPSTVKCRFQDMEVVENVANVNGILITLLIEYRIHGKLNVLEELKKRLHSLCKEDEEPAWLRHSDTRRKLKSLKTDHLSFPEDFITVALLLEAESTETSHRFKQINQRDWINTSHYDDIGKSLNTLITDSSQFEQPFSSKEKIRGRKLHGRVDIIDHEKKILYELKYVTTLTEVHKIQLLLYYYLACENDDKYYDYSLVILNLKDGKKHTITPLEDDLFPLVDYMVYMKFANKPQISFDKFEKNFSIMMAKYFDENGKAKPQRETQKSIEKSVPLKKVKTDGEPMKRSMLLNDDDD